VTTQIVIDCDPGHDDAMALLLALASPEVEVIGVTTVHGNTTLAKTTPNALRVLELAGRSDIPVAAGADAPLTRDPFVAEYVHGASGMDGPALPPPSAAPVEQHAVDFLAERLGPGVVLVPTGPLTNVALPPAPALVEPKVGFGMSHCGWTEPCGSLAPSTKSEIEPGPAPEAGSLRSARSVFPLSCPSLIAMTSPTAVPSGTERQSAERPLVGVQSARVPRLIDATPCAASTTGS